MTEKQNHYRSSTEYDVDASAVLTTRVFQEIFKVKHMSEVTPPSPT